MDSFLADNKMMIVAGVGGVGVLWFLMRGHSSGNRVITSSSPSVSPVAVAQANAMGTEAEANLTKARASMVAATGMSRSNVIRANNQRVLASYLAGTTIADNALQAAGKTEMVGLASVSAATQSYNVALASIAGGSAKTIQKVARSNASDKASLSFGLPGVGSFGVSV